MVTSRNTVMTSRDTAMTSRDIVITSRDIVIELTSSLVAVSSPALQSHLLLRMKMFGCDNFAFTRLKKLFSCKINFVIKL